MRRRTFLAASSALAATVALPAAALAHAPGSNPTAAEWTGPFGGVPAFDKVRIEQFKPALEAGMAAEWTEIEAIANNPAAPTFANTIEAMERSGAMLDRTQTVYGIWVAT